MLSLGAGRAALVPLHLCRSNCALARPARAASAVVVPRSRRPTSAGARRTVCAAASSPLELHSDKAFGALAGKQVGAQAFSLTYWGILQD